MDEKDDGSKLNTYLEDYWEHQLRNNPTFATYIGDHRYNSILEDLSEVSIAGQADYFRALLVKLDDIKETSLTSEDRVNYKLLRNTLTNHIAMYQYRTHCIPLDHMQGPHIDFPQLIEFHPFKTPFDFEQYAARLRAFPRQTDQVMDLMESGIKYNITAFRKIIEHVLRQVETFTRFSPENSPLFAPVNKLGREFTAREKEDIRGTVTEAISSSVTPSYKKLHQYLSRQYLHQCREKEGIWSLPDGDDLYRFYIRYHTTTGHSPEEIHAIGTGEVKRIEDDIRAVMGRIGFKGTIREFSDALKKNKELYPETGEEILASYRDILREMDRKLPQYFGRLPKAKYAVKEIEKYREQAAPAAYYYPPPRDFSRPGYFYANTFNPQQRPKYEMEALSYHEAVPGHHLQIALMQEREDIPDFRRHEGSTAFIEGWALYAEKLSKEMGFYRDDYAVYGRLSFELWRAVRLVVDTGLHFYRWSREEAVRYCKENTGLEDHEIEVEVDRYIAMPGQALAYKTGELKILELREKAKQTLAAKFDIKEFHDRLLEKGALPLHILEDVMIEWIAVKGEGASPLQEF